MSVWVTNTVSISVLVSTTVSVLTSGKNNQCIKNAPRAIPMSPNVKRLSMSIQNSRSKDSLYSHSESLYDLV